MSMSKDGERKLTWQESALADPNASPYGTDLAPTPGAGRALDALVAEKVMGVVWPKDRCPICGWTYLYKTYQGGCEPGNCSMRPKPDHRADEPAHYSTDIAAALAVAEHLRRTRGLGYVIGTNGMAMQQNGVKFFEGFHGAGHSIFDAEPHPGWYRVADTIPLALCKAALAYANSVPAAPPRAPNE